MDNQEKDFVQIDIMLLLRRIWSQKTNNSVNNASFYSWGTNV